MIKTVSVPSVIQQDRPWTPGVPGFTPAWDLGILLHLSKMCEGDILEIGCNQGSTTFQLATENPTRHIIGVDWSGPATMVPEQINEQQLQGQNMGKAARSLPNVEIWDINSRLLDYIHPKLNGVRFVFVDGDHSYQGVKADSEKALAHLMFSRPKDPERRAIVWHDYCPLEWRDKSPAWLQVGDYLREELTKYDLMHFSGSAVAALLLGDWPENIFAGY